MVEYLVIYDGDCGICSFSADWIKKHDKKSIFNVIPSYNIDTMDFDTDYIRSLINMTVILYNIKTKSIMTESAAVFNILRKLNGIYKILGLIFSNKLSYIIFNPFYRLIAENRAAISSKLGLNACKIN